MFVELCLLGRDSKYCSIRSHIGLMLRFDAALCIFDVSDIVLIPHRSFIDL